MTMELEYNRDLYGVEHEAGPFEITRRTDPDLQSQHRRDQPGYSPTKRRRRRPAIPASLPPPTFCTLLVRNVELPDIDLKFGRTRFHAGQRIQSRAPVVAGDRLTASSHLKEVYPKTGRSGTMVFQVWETTFRNQHGTVVADVQESYAARE